MNIHALWKALHHLTSHLNHASPCCTLRPRAFFTIARREYPQKPPRNGSFNLFLLLPENKSNMFPYFSKKKHLSINRMTASCENKTNWILYQILYNNNMIFHLLLYTTSDNVFRNGNDSLRSTSMMTWYFINDNTSFNKFSMNSTKSLQYTILNSNCTVWIRALIYLFLEAPR